MLTVRDTHTNAVVIVPAAADAVSVCVSVCSDLLGSVFLMLLSPSARSPVPSSADCSIRF